MKSQPLEFDIVKPKIKLGYSFVSYYLITAGSSILHFFTLYYMGLSVRRFFDFNNSIFDVLFWILSIALFIIFFIYLNKLEKVLFPVQKTGRFVIGTDRFIIYYEGMRKEIVFDTLEHIRRVNGVGVSRLAPIAFDLKFVYKDYSTEWVCSVISKNPFIDLISVFARHKELKKQQIELF